LTAIGGTVDGISDLSMPEMKSLTRMPLSVEGNAHLRRARSSSLRAWHNQSPIGCGPIRRPFPGIDRSNVTAIMHFFGRGKREKQS